MTLSTNTTLSEKIYKLSEFNNDVDQNYLKLDIKKYDLNCESAYIVSYLLTKQMDKEGRIINSNEFGEYVSSLSFQHGLGVWVRYIKVVNIYMLTLYYLEKRAIYGLFLMFTIEQMMNFIIIHPKNWYII